MRMWWFPWGVAIGVGVIAYLLLMVAVALLLLRRLLQLGARTAVDDDSK